MTTDVLLLLLAFQVKHLIADYYLQLPYMYENKGKKEGWIYPLLDHSAVHASGTLLIVFFYVAYGLGFNLASLILAVVFSLFDLITHFAIDRWKATRKATPDQSKFWYYLGIDQMLHHTVGILIIWLIT